MRYFSLRNYLRIKRGVKNAEFVATADFLSQHGTYYNKLNVDAYINLNTLKKPQKYTSGPGSTKEAIITKGSLRKLTISVQTPNPAMRRSYNFFQMKKLAQDPYLDFKKKTMLYIGGYMDSPSFPFATILAMKYIQLGYNVLLLDTNAFTTMEYPRAARFIRPVGKNTAIMLAHLTREGLQPQKLEMVGLSLGCQTASFIAKNYRLLTNKNISRITGLDPAGPCFRHLSSNDRLSKDDADFVDVVNTNIDAFGMATPVGHVNFYVNGGEYQPGDVYWAYCAIFCSHIRSYILWVSSLNNGDSFIAIKCDSVQQARERNCFNRTPIETNVLGLNTDRNKPGIFYLATGNTYPYYLGEEGLKKENDFFVSFTKSLNDDNTLKV